MKTPPELGQINLNSEMGKMLYEIALKDGINRIVEIGTWNGCGSTYCLARGIFDSKKENAIFYSLESNQEFFSKAQSLYDDLDFCKVIHGRILDLEEMIHKPEDFQPPQKDWLIQDIKALNSCPNVFNQLPIEIDLLLLDGGEFSTLVEYRKLKDRVSQYIALDDTLVLKNSEVEKDLESDKAFDCVHKSSDRNGWSIFKRK